MVFYVKLSTLLLQQLRILGNNKGGAEDDLTVETRHPQTFGLQTLQVILDYRQAVHCATNKL
jgi:hypothetical protein